MKIRDNMLRNIFNKLEKPALFVISVGVLAFVVTYVMESRSVKSKSETQKSTANRIETSNVDLANFCKYDLEDYETLKPKVERLFLDDPSMTTANIILQNISNIEIGQKHKLPKITGKRLVLKDGDVTFSGESLSTARVVCLKNYENRDEWNFFFHVNAYGKILNFDFFITIDDKNFAKRKLPLKPKYILSRNSINLAIKSLVEEHNYSISRFIEYLNANGFPVERNGSTKNGEEKYKVTIENIRHANKILPLPGASNGQFTLNLIVKPSGKIISIAR